VLMIAVISAYRVDTIVSMFSEPIANVNINVIVVELPNGTTNGAFLHRRITEEYLTRVIDKYESSCERLMMLRDTNGKYRKVSVNFLDSANDSTLFHNSEMFSVNGYCIARDRSLQSTTIVLSN